MASVHQPACIGWAWGCCSTCATCCAAWGDTEPECLGLPHARRRPGPQAECLAGLRAQAVRGRGLADLASPGRKVLPPAHTEPAQRGRKAVLRALLRAPSAHHTPWVLWKTSACMPGPEPFRPLCAVPAGRPARPARASSRLAVCTITRTPLPVLISHLRDQLMSGPERQACQHAAGQLDTARARAPLAVVAPVVVVLWARHLEVAVAHVVAQPLPERAKVKAARAGKRQAPSA